MAKTNDNVELADMFFHSLERREDLIYVKEIDALLLYQKEKHYYKVYNDTEIETEVLYHFFRDKAKNLTKHMMRDLIYHIKMSVATRFQNINYRYVALKDQILDLSSMEFVPFNDDIFAVHYLPYTKNEILTTETPNFNAFIQKVIVNDKKVPDIELQKVLQEMFGYYLMDEMKPSTAFFLIGKGANGKSVVLKILAELIGKDYINNKSIQTLTTQLFATSSFAGKKINICNEEESKYLKSDRFKAFITGDPVEGVHKYGDYYNFTPTTKFIFAMNGWPSFDGIDHGLKRRLMIFPFLCQLTEAEQDRNLFEEKIKPELAGIIRFAINGAKRLREQKYQFTPSEQIDKSMEEFEGNVSGAIMFIREKYVESEGGFISNMSLYKEYAEWSKDNGRKALNSSNFARDVSSVLKIESKIRRVPEYINPQRGRFLVPLIHKESPYDA